MLNHPTGLFSGDYRGAGPSNFYTPYNSEKCISSRTWGAGRPHVGLCPIFLVWLRNGRVWLSSMACPRTEQLRGSAKQPNVLCVYDGDSDGTQKRISWLTRSCSFAGSVP